MNQIEEVKAFYKVFMTTFFTERNVDRAVEMFAKDATFVGSGQRVASESREEIYRYFREEVALNSEPFQIQYEEVNVKHISSGVYSLVAEVIISQSIGHLATTAIYFRQSAMIARKAGQFHFMMLHISTPLESHEFEEFYPTKWDSRHKGASSLVEQNLIIEKNLVTRDWGADLPGGILAMFEEEGHPIYFSNDQLLHFLDYSREEFLEMTSGMAINCIHPYDRERFEQAVQSAYLGEGKTYQVEFRMAKKDGSYLWALNVGREGVLSSGEKVIISVIFDVTHTHECKQKLQNQVTQIEQITTQLNCGIRVGNYDDAMSTVYISESLADILGYSVDEMKKHFVQEEHSFIYLKDLARVHREVKEAFLDGPDYTSTYRVQHKNGGLVWVKDQGRKFLDVDGNIRISSIIVDMSETNNLVERLTRSEEKMRVAMSETGVTVWEFDVLRKEVVWNRSENPWKKTQKIYHNVPEGQIEQGIFHPNSIHAVRRLYERIESGAERAQAEVQMLDDDGKFCWKRIHYTTIFDQRGRAERAIAVVVDISNEKEVMGHFRKEIENNSEKESTTNHVLADALQEAERANKEKTQFISRLSHDIRTPMNSIIGMTSLVRENVHKQDKVEEYMDKIESSSNYLVSLVNDILDVTKIESGKMKIERESFFLSMVIQEVSFVIQNRFTYKNIELSIDDSGVETDCIKGDVMRLRQILMNLMSNAYKYTEPGGHVSITIRQEKSTDNYIMTLFTVEDDGIGISKDKLEHVFQPFEQDEVSHDIRVGSTGLGLSIVKSLVSLLDGSIQVDSDLGKGTRFDVALLFAKGDEKQAKVGKKLDDKRMHASYQGERILLVEDNELNAEIAKTILESRKLKVDIANNGQEAVYMFANSAKGYYKVILMDIRMPVMDGREATKTIRRLSREDAKSIPIIGMSADAFSEDIQKCMQLGMDDYLTKPVDNRLMFDTLGKYL